MNTEQGKKKKVVKIEENFSCRENDSQAGERDALCDLHKLWHNFFPLLLFLFFIHPLLFPSLALTLSFLSLREEKEKRN